MTNVLPFPPRARADAVACGQKRIAMAAERVAKARNRIELLDTVPTAASIDNAIRAMRLAHESLIALRAQFLGSPRGRGLGGRR